MSNIQQKVLSFENERMIFNGHTHQVVGVLSSVSSSERVGIAIADVQLDEPTAEELATKTVIELPKTKPTDNILGDRNEILVYKHNGRFYVLAGVDRVRNYHVEGKTHFKAKIVSSPALKKTRVVSEPQEPIRSIADNRPPARVSESMNAWPRTESRHPPRAPSRGGYTKDRY